MKSLILIYAIDNFYTALNFFRFAVFIHSIAMFTRYKYLPLNFFKLSHRYVQTKPTFLLKRSARLMDECDDISVIGLEANTEYTLTSETTTDTGHQFGSYGHYISNKEGEIVLSRDEAVGGMYKGVESMGWMWAMEPSPMNKRKYARFVKHSSETPLNVSLGINLGFLNDFDSIFHERRTSICQTQIQKWYAAKNVTKIRINNGKVNGLLFVPPGQPPFPAVISMYGGALTAIEHEFRPALLASHGFVTLSLEYITGMESFADGINLEIFEEAINYLINHKCVKSEKGIGVYGISKGGSVGLAMASYLPNISCVVCINGSIYPDFANLYYKSKVVCNGCPVDMTLLKEVKDSNGIYDFRKCFMTPDYPESAPGIIEFYKQHNTAIMIAASMDDRNVNAPYYADKAEMLLQKYKHPCFEVKRYDAGHLLEPPYAPLCNAAYTDFINKVIDFGGKPEPHCRAQELSWKRHLKFLNDHL